MKAARYLILALVCICSCSNSNHEKIISASKTEHGCKIVRGATVYKFNIDTANTLSFTAVITWSKNTDTALIIPILEYALGVCLYPGLDTIYCVGENGAVSVEDLRRIQIEGRDTILDHKLPDNIIFKIISSDTLFLDRIYFMTTKNK